MNTLVRVIAGALTMAFLVAAAPLPRSVCEPATYPSSPLRGSYATFDRREGCPYYDYGLAVGLALQPIFTREILTPAGCRLSVATIRDDRVVNLAVAPSGIKGSRVAEAADGSFWIVTGEPEDAAYYHLTSDGRLMTQPVFHNGDYAAEVFADSMGHVFGSELMNSQGPDSTIIVSFDSMKSLSVRSRGAGFVRGADGKLYLNLTSPKDSSLFELRPDGSRLLESKVFAEQYAVDSNGNIWRPQSTGLIKTDRIGRVLQTVRGIIPLPCTISNTAVLEPRYLVAQSDGSLWFLLSRKLWRLQADGTLGFADLPSDDLVYSVVGGQPGTIWLAIGDRGALYRYR